MSERFEYVSLDKIKVKKYNVRVHGIDQGIQDLAENIRVNGLLQPITAYYDTEKAIYVILTGQRRLNAYDYLNENYPGMGYDSIQCKIIPEPKTDDRKKSLSLAENITQLPMTEQDLRRAVTDLYNIYGDYNLVKEKFGISTQMINKYVRLARLPLELKEAIQQGEIHSDPKKAENASLHAVDALNYVKGGIIPVDAVIKLAIEMAKSDISLKDVTREVPRGGTVPEIIARAKKKPKSKLSIDLSRETAEKLQSVAQSNGESEKQRATQYVVDGVDNDYGRIGD